jgi:hypothetical protein
MFTNLSLILEMSYASQRKWLYVESAEIKFSSNEKWSKMQNDLK